jgi:hypothetical protein
MNPTPDFGAMSEAERAAWHESQAGRPRHGLVVKRRTRSVADAHLSVRLLADQINRLKMLASTEHMSVSGLVRRIVEVELNRRLPADMATENLVTGLKPAVKIRMTPAVTAGASTESWAFGDVQLERYMASGW